MEIVRGFANLPKITLSTCGRDDDVFIDRLNYKYTTMILFISSITITVKILQADHIQCWVIGIFCSIFNWHTFYFYWVSEFESKDYSEEFKIYFKHEWVIMSQLDE